MSLIHSDFVAATVVAQSILQLFYTFNLGSRKHMIHFIHIHTTWRRPSASLISAMTSPQTPDVPSIAPQCYYCVHCTTPCDSLYRQYTASVSSIKLASCSSCGSDVDPYIERELLLVVLDCSLLRIKAFRHVLWHRLQTKRVLQSLLASTLLHAYLDYEAFRQLPGEHEIHPNLFWIMWMQSLLDTLVFWVCASWSFSILADVTNAAARARLSSLLFWALCLPTTLHVVTILVLVWENSAAVKQLASVYVLLMQCMGVHVVVATAASTPFNKTTAHKPISRQVPFVAIALGLFARASTRRGVSIILQETLPCTGMDVMGLCLVT